MHQPCAPRLGGAGQRPDRERIHGKRLGRLALRRVHMVEGRAIDDHVGLCIVDNTLHGIDVGDVERRARHRRDITVGEGAEHGRRQLT